MPQFRRSFQERGYISFVNNVLPKRAFPAPIEKMAKTPIIIDCDPGIDDAVALALAFSARDELNILAVTTVAGNVPLELTARNARIMRELARREDVPVYAGSARPLVREPVFAADFHGESGLEGIEIFDPRQPLGDGHAALKIIEHIRASSEPVQLLVTGPLTNIALALSLAPDIGSNISELVIMGGADTEGGNITPTAEFNIFADPHAAQIVFEKSYAAGEGLPTTVFSLDFTHTVRATRERVSAMRASGGALSGHVANLLEAMNAFEEEMVGGDAGPLHDPCTVVYALAPDLFGSRTGSVRVITEPGDRYGQTVFAEQERGVKWIANWPGMDASDAIFELLAERIGA